MHNIYGFCMLSVRLFTGLALLLWIMRAEALDSAEQIFEAIEPSVFQIQIIETKSSSQVSLGTGFLVGEGLVATNYHVVSDAVLEPNKHRIEIETEDQTLTLDVRTVDVVNDLAILSVAFNFEGAKPFVLAEEDARQGSIIYSLGNPHNIGMTVVQGNYNGYAEHSFVDRIHFSGAVNAGMSGGPAVNSDAEVIGVNVASAGNQIGFLVPVKHLRELLSKSQSLPTDYQLLADMALQIATTTDAMVETLLEGDWPTEQMGEAVILGQISDWMDCWGNSNDNQETEVSDIARGCNNADNIFVSDELYTGYFEYEYFYKEAPTWPVDAFYRQWRADTSSAVPGNRATKKHVYNYQCVNEIVTTHEQSEQQITRRVSFCMRAYKKLPGLYDAFFVGVTNDKDRVGVMDHFTLSGVTEESAKSFLTRFLGVLAWQ